MKSCWRVADMSGREGIDMTNKLPVLKRRLVSSDDAVRMKTQHRKPCADCPFARTALPGWTGAKAPYYFTVAAHGEDYMDCHCTTNMQCAGAAIFRANVMKIPKNPQHLKLEPDMKLVFATDAEFLKHHNRS